MGKMRMFLRQSSVGREPLAVTMSAVRLGERVLQVGVDDPKVAAAIAAKTGMTGLATIVVADDIAAGTARTAAAEAGALADVRVEPYGSLPFNDAGYDVVIVHASGGLLDTMDAAQRDQALRECRRVLRPGGRLMALEAGAPTGLRGLFGGGPKRNAEYEAAGGTLGALKAAGFGAVRVLGDRQGYRFIEGLNA
jgi:ubiquinone/menaquinone biosynthesis C-methylase UbiE